MWTRKYKHAFNQRDMNQRDMSTVFMDTRKSPAFLPPGKVSDMFQDTEELGACLWMSCSVLVDVTRTSSFYQESSFLYHEWTCVVRYTHHTAHLKCHKTAVQVKMCINGVKQWSVSHSGSKSSCIWIYTTLLLETLERSSFLTTTDISPFMQLFHTYLQTSSCI